MLAKQGLLVIATGVVTAVVAACASEEARYRALSFFFDGVPEPGSAVQLSRDAPQVDLAPVTPAGQIVVERLIPHTPYKENRCEGCHDATSGQLTRTLEHGLCLTCHVKLLEGLRHVHGPVAVSGCSECHHYHAAPHPNLLLVDVVETCFQCHSSGDLSAGDHHADPARSCTECHDPHGGDDRFFLKRTEP